MSKSWIRTILLLAMAVLCLVGAIAMKACSLDDAVDASYTEVDSSSTANSDTEADSAVVDESSSENINGIKVVFSDEEDDSSSASVEEQDESKEEEQASSEEEEVPAVPTPAVTSEPVSSQPTEEPPVAVTPVPEPTPEPPAESAPIPPATESVPEQNPGYADNGWKPEAAEHYHGNGSDAGTCPACGLIYGPAGGAEGQYGEQDGLMD